MKVAVITARGGSKRIPRKNIREFCGKPILAYSIDAALNSGIFDEVMISTEDDEIAEIAVKYGASFPFRRSAENADDHSTSVDVMCEVLDCYDKLGKHPDIMCCLYPTAPFVTAEKLKNAYELLEKNNANAVIPVVKFSFPPQRCFIQKDGFVEYKWKEYQFSRSQDLEPFYHDAGQFVIIRSDVMKEKHSLIPNRTVPFILDDMEVQDIDTLDDWEIAEIKYGIMSR